MLALTLTAIGLIPIATSAIKGVGKLEVKNADTSMEPILAGLRKLGKGDVVKYLRDPSTWKQIESDTVRLLLEQIDTAHTQLTKLRDGFVSNTC